MGDIFICHTLYHVLIALVRALRSRPGKSTLVLSTCVPEAETLRAKLLDAAPDLWDAVLIVDEEKLDAQNSESDFYRPAAAVPRWLLPPAPPVPQAVFYAAQGACVHQQ